MQENDEQVRELCTRIIAERNPDRLIALTAQLDAILAEREEKLRRKIQQS